MSHADAVQLRDFRDKCYALAGHGRVLCRCCDCEEDVPLHERLNYVAASTANTHRRRTGLQGPAAYRKDEIVESLRVWLGLHTVTEALRQAQQGAGEEQEKEQGSNSADNGNETEQPGLGSGS